MGAVSLQTAIAITGKSRRTLWRRIEAADLRRDGENSRNKTLLDGDWVRQNGLVNMDDEAWRLVLAADGGDADAQNEVGVLFLEAKIDAVALYWFEQAAAQNHADALHWLAHCHVAGKGAPENHALGMMYLARAANLGHVIASEQLSAIHRQVLR